MLISCADRPGIVAAVSRFLFEHGANILDADQHSTDPQGGTFIASKFVPENKDLLGSPDATPSAA